jgi:hypothetical protein
MLGNSITAKSKIAKMMVDVMTATTTLLLLTAKGVFGAEIPDGGTQYPHFIAMNDTMTCVGETHATPFNTQVRGVNLGGWMVLEPWITPSLFYQFLGKGEGEIAMDSYTFCEVLGAKEANQQLRRHVSLKEKSKMPYL